MRFLRVRLKVRMSEKITNKGTSGEYGRVVKYLGLLGGAQGLSLLVNLLRNKIASTLLGAVGLGLIGLYNRTVQMFSDCTNLSLSYSAIRKLSDTYENATAEDLAHYVKVTRSIALLTGIVGMLLFVVLSDVKSMSKSSGNGNWHFDWSSGIGHGGSGISTIQYRFAKRASADRSGDFAAVGRIAQVNTAGI